MLMLKRSIRWIIPLAVLAILVICFVVVPAIVSHAASAVPSNGYSDGSSTTPDLQWNH